MKIKKQKKIFGNEYEKNETQKKNQNQNNEKPIIMKT